VLTLVLLDYFGSVKKWKRLNLLILATSMRLQSRGIIPKKSKTQNMKDVGNS
jgi:hypothetical protein